MVVPNQTKDFKDENQENKPKFIKKSGAYHALIVYTESAVRLLSARTARSIHHPVLHFDGRLRGVHESAGRVSQIAVTVERTRFGRIRWGGHPEIVPVVGERNTIEATALTLPKGLLRRIAILKRAKIGFLEGFPKGFREAFRREEKFWR